MPYSSSQIPDVGRILRTFRKTAKAVMRVEVETFADSSRLDFIQRVETQDFPAFDLFPLSPAYMKRKIKAGADTRTMIATHHYLSSIELFQNVDGSSVAYRVGFKPDALAWDMYGKVTTMPLDVVAKVQEFGSAKANIPARPHWMPHYVTMRENAVDVRSAIKVKVRAAFKKRMPEFA